MSPACHRDLRRRVGKILDIPSTQSRTGLRYKHAGPRTGPATRPQIFPSASPKKPCGEHRGIGVADPPQVARVMPLREWPDIVGRSVSDPFRPAGPVMPPNAPSRSCKPRRIAEFDRADQHPSRPRACASSPIIAFGFSLDQRPGPFYAATKGAAVLRRSVQVHDLGPVRPVLRAQRGVARKNRDIMGSTTASQRAGRHDPPDFFADLSSELRSTRLVIGENAALESPISSERVGAGG